MTNLREILIFVCVVWCSSLCSRGAGSNVVEIVDGFHGIEQMQRTERKEIGGEFANRFLVPTREQALAKVTKLRELQEVVTVERFLGGKIKFVRVTFFDSSLKDFEAARSFLQDLLRASIMSPAAGPIQEGPFLYHARAEASEDSIKALIFYENGSIGRIESDGWHLFVEDSDGTYWWHRLTTRIKPGGG